MDQFNFMTYLSNMFIAKLFFDMNTIIYIHRRLMMMSREINDAIIKWKKQP